MWQKEKQQKFTAKEPVNFVNRKIEKEEQAPVVVDEDKSNNRKNKLNKKRKMLEEKLEENNQAMKKIKTRKNDIF